ncbi:DUF2868 domain-containing protein [Aliikangiella marina]|uniref:DUF2868 domain-containing protein n=1 Tax=Aliikangiella marina TaxID=1712262 RepID=UPI00163DDDF6|nr:DUF2868 domain-containing protein [Aliikangiella marina]
MSGDAQGRVNLLYLLLIYLLLPIVSLLVSLLSLIKGKGINLARLALAAPLWGHSIQQRLHRLAQCSLDKHWLFFQSQAAALGFSLASLATFFMLLIATDINFVWRSTILDAADMLPVLEFWASPWSFWQSAQPSLELLQMTQDSRINGSHSSANLYAAWWPFVLATQLFYCVVLRTGLLIVVFQLYKVKQRSDFTNQLSSEIFSSTVRQENLEYAPLVHEIPHWLAVNNWAGAELELLTSVNHGMRMDNLMNAGPLASEQERGFAARWQGEQVILVKAWEPPLGELSDFMINGSGFIWPLDWKQNQLTKVNQNHLDEWRRFVAKHKNWQVYLPNSLLPTDYVHSETSS